MTEGDREPDGRDLGVETERGTEVDRGTDADREPETERETDVEREWKDGGIAEATIGDIGMISLGSLS